MVTGFYRTCVIDTVLEHSPAEYVRRPVVPNESPPLGLSHLQLEALLTAARESISPFGFALVAMLGLLGLRVFEACAADISDIGEEHGHRVLRVIGKGSKAVRTTTYRAWRRKELIAALSRPRASSTSPGTSRRRTATTSRS